MCGFFKESGVYGIVKDIENCTTGAQNKRTCVCIFIHIYLWNWLSDLGFGFCPVFVHSFVDAGRGRRRER